MTGGIYRLQRHTVLNMLMRGNRRYYDADKSVVRNLLQCANERMRDYAARIGIVEWLHGNRHEEGPAGAVGFHRFSDLCQDLIGAGHDAATVREQADYLLRCALIECEHQEPIIKDEGDLLRISASGVVHYGLLKDATYIAACAEDTLVDDIVIAQDILQGMTLANAEKGYSRESVDINSAVLLNYLTEQERIFCTGLPPENRARDCYRSADYIRRVVLGGKSMRKRASELLWKHAWHKRVGSKVHGRVESVVASIGIFVWIDGGPTGLVPNASLAKIKFAATLQPGDRVTVEVQRVDQRKGTGRLLLLARVADQGSSSTSRDGSKL